MNNEDNQSQGFDIFKLMSFISAFLALIGFTIFLKFLVGKVAAPDSEWIRLMDLFGSVEAIVFAAAGFIFGREVNRQRANSAEKTVKKKEEELEGAKSKEDNQREKAEKNEKIALQLKAAINAFAAKNKELRTNAEANLKGFKDQDSPLTLMNEPLNLDYLVEYANNLEIAAFNIDYASFDWKINPKEKIASVEINKNEYKPDEAERCYNVPLSNNRFTIYVRMKSGYEHTRWTFEAINIEDDFGRSLKHRSGGKNVRGTNDKIGLER